MDQTSFQKKSDGPNGLIREVIHFMNPAFIVRVISCLALLITGLSFSARMSAQEAEAFKPGGKPEVRIFTSLNSAFTDGENHTKFDVTRAYLGYNYNFTKNLSGRVVYDAANPTVGKLQFTGMLKFAYLKYQTDKWTISGGMIALPEYDFGDKKWGYRYVFKTAHEGYGFAPAADLGLSVGYKIAPWLSADVTLMNGEGFRVNEADSTLKKAAGLTIIPVKNFSLRCYYDDMGRNSDRQQTVEVITAYENKGYVISAVYNYQKNNNMMAGHDYQVLSFNGNIPVKDKIKIFGRFDYLYSETVEDEEDPWNQAKDGRLYLIGVDIAIAPGIHISPNYQGWQPAGTDMPFISRFSLSLDLKI